MTEWNELRLPYQLQWFAKDGPGGEKTEEPTAKRLTDARKDGKVAKSKELNSAFDLIVLFLLLKIFISYLYDGFLNVFDGSLNRNLQKRCSQAFDHTDRIGIRAVRRSKSRHRNGLNPLSIQP